MKQLNNLIQKCSFILLSGTIFLGISMPLLAMDWKEQDAQAGTPNLAELFNTLTAGQEATINTNANDEPTPQCSQSIWAHTFENIITSAVIVPCSQNVLVSTHNSLHLLDTAHNKIVQTLSFNRPIAKLILSSNGNLCAVLLIPNKNEKPVIQFVNCCNNSVEFNDKINPVTYLRADNYEITQEAALSADGSWLATLDTNSLVSLHNLATNKSFKNIAPKANPVFSVDCSKNILAVHADLETSLYSVSADTNECLLLRKFNHPELITEIDYVSRQGAWLVDDMIFVRIGNKAGVYNAKSELIQTLTVGATNYIYPCPNDKHSFIELKPIKKAFRVHNLSMAATPIKTETNICKTLQKILFDKSSEEQITLCAQNKTLVTRNRNAQAIIAMAQPPTSLSQAIFKNNAKSVKTLIKIKAPESNCDAKELAKAFKHAAFQGFAEVIQALLTTIPQSEQAKILQARDNMLLLHILASKQSTTRQPWDIRAMIDRALIDTLVTQQIERVELMLKTFDAQDAYNTAKMGDNVRLMAAPRLVNVGHNSKPQEANPHSASELLDPENSFLRKQLLEKSIREILFGKPQDTGE
jgi:hypothetical protein